MAETAYNIDYQRSVIKLLAINIKFSVQYSDILTEGYFETKPLRIIFKLIKDFQNKYEREMARTELITQIDEYVIVKGLSDDIYTMMKEEVYNIFKTAISSEQFVIDQLIKFARRQGLKSAVLDIIDILDSDGSYESAVNLINKAVSIGSGGGGGLSFEDLRNYPQLYKEIYNASNLANTGFMGYDNALMGGYGPGEVHLLCAPPKAGKSTFACNVGAANIIRGRVVYHASLEINEVMVMSKYGTRLTGMTYSQTLAHESEYIKKITKLGKMDPKLYIEHWPEGTASTLNIRSWIVKKKIETGDSPDLIILDYDDNLTGDTLIPLLNGTKVPISELSDRDEFWLYACKEDGTIVPGRGHSVRHKYFTTMIKITLDNGKVIKSCENHKHMLRDGSYKHAKDIKVNDSMMPFYRNKELVENREYELVRNNNSKEYEYTHQLVAKNIYKQELIDCKIRCEESKKTVYPQVHHTKLKEDSDYRFNSLNNDPNNLQWVTSGEHFTIHNNVLWASPEWSEYKSKSTEAQWTPEFHEKRSKETTEQWETTDIGDRVSTAFSENWVEGSFTEHKTEPCPHCNIMLDLPFTKWRSHLQHCSENPEKVKQVNNKNEVRMRYCNICNTNIELTWHGLRAHKRRCKTITTQVCNYCDKTLTLPLTDIREHIYRCSVADNKVVRGRSCEICSTNLNTDIRGMSNHKRVCNPNNHKVSKVEIIKLDKPEPMYCLTVDDYHNYALDAGIFTHNCLLPSTGKSTDMYNDAGQIYDDLIQLAKYFDCPILTMAQPQRHAWEKPNNGELISSYDLAHSARKAHKCSSVSSLNFREGETEGILYVDLVRRGESSVKIPIRREFTRGLMIESASISSTE